MPENWFQLLCCVYENCERASIHEYTTGDQSLENKTQATVLWFYLRPLKTQAHTHPARLLRRTLHGLYPDLRAIKPFPSPRINEK